MTTAIWKFPIEIGHTVITTCPIADLGAPPSASVRHVGLDPVGVPCIWIEVDPTDGATTRRVQVNIVGTGHHFEGELGTHVGTFVQHSFVWHAHVSR